MALDITSQKTSVTAWLTKLLYIRKFIIIIIIIIIVGVVIVKGFGEKNPVIAVVKFGTGCKHLNVRPRK
jgi:amino acid permease